MQDYFRLTAKPKKILDGGTLLLLKVVLRSIFTQFIFLHFPLLDDSLTYLTIFSSSTRKKVNLSNHLVQDCEAGIIWSYLPTYLASYLPK